MLFVGLTGGIGSGKSETLAAWERLGAAVLSTDAIVHELLATDELRDELVRRWGEPVLAPDGRLSREAIAEIVFEQPEELRWLEGVLFPRVGARIAQWRSQLERGGERVEVAVVEVPLLFEAGIADAFDATVAVVAGEGVRAQRAQARLHRALDGRQTRQLTEEEKARRADHVIRNDGTLADLEQAVRRLLDELRPTSVP